MGYNRGEASCSYSSSLPSTFPYGLRILVVDDDPTCLMIVEKMLKKCKYEGIRIQMSWIFFPFFFSVFLTLKDSSWLDPFHSGVYFFICWGCDGGFVGPK